MSQQIPRPPKLPIKIKAAPKIRQMYWCQFPKDSQLPEMWKKRPVIIVSKVNKLDGCVTVVPCSSKEQWNQKWCVSLSDTIDDMESYAICNQITSVATSRLEIHRLPVKRVREEDFDLIVEKMISNLPQKN